MLDLTLRNVFLSWPEVGSGEDGQKFHPISILPKENTYLFHGSPGHKEDAHQSFWYCQILERISFAKHKRTTSNVLCTHLPKPALCLYSISMHLLLPERRVWVLTSNKTFPSIFSGLKDENHHIVLLCLEVLVQISWC